MIKRKNSYIFKHSISDRFYDDLYKASSIDSEKEALEKLFRPHDWLLKYLCKHNQFNFMPMDDLDAVAENNGLNKAFIDFNSILALKGDYKAGIDSRKKRSEGEVD